MIGNIELKHFLGTCDKKFKRFSDDGTYDIHYIREGVGKASKLFFDEENTKKAQIITMCDRIGCDEVTINKIIALETEEQFEALYDEIEKKIIYLVKMSNYLEQIELFGWHWYSGTCVKDAVKHGKTLDDIINNMAIEITEPDENNDDRENNNEPDYDYRILDFEQFLFDIQPYIEEMVVNNPNDTVFDEDTIEFYEGFVAVFEYHVYSALQHFSQRQKLMAILEWLSSDSNFTEEVDEQFGKGTAQIVAQHIKKYEVDCRIRLLEPFFGEMYRIADTETPNNQSKEMQEISESLVKKCYEYWGGKNLIENHKEMKYFIDEHLEVYIRNIQDVKSEEKWKMKTVKSAIEYYFKKCKTQNKNN